MKTELKRRRKRRGVRTPLCCLKSRLNRRQERIVPKNKPVLFWKEARGALSDQLRIEHQECRSNQESDLTWRMF